MEIILHDDWTPTSPDMTEEELWELLNKYSRWDVSPFGVGYILVAFYDEDN
jgi:hypothetical protein